MPTSRWAGCAPELAALAARIESATAALTPQAEAVHAAAEAAQRAARAIADLAHRQEVHDRDVTELRAAYTATVDTVTADRDRERADHQALLEDLARHPCRRAHLDAR